MKRPDCFVWVALYEPDAGRAGAVMQKEFDLHELAVEDAQTGHQRPKIEEYGNSLFVVLHTVELEAKSLRVGEVDVFAGPNYVLSVRNRTKRGFADVRARCEAEPESAAPWLGVRAVRADGLRRRSLLPGARSARDRVREPRGADLRRRARAPEHRGAVRAQAEADGAAARLRPALEGVGKLYGGRVPQVCEGTQEYFRDVYDHLGRINQTIDGIRDSVTTAMSVSLSLHPAAGQRDDQAARRLRRRWSRCRR